MATRFGSAIANVMSVVARALGYIIYGLLRAIYWPKVRAFALIGIALVAAIIIAGVLLR